MSSWETRELVHSLPTCTPRKGHVGHSKKVAVYSPGRSLTRSGSAGSKTFKGWGFLNDPDPLSAVGDSHGLVPGRFSSSSPWDKDFSFSFSSLIWSSLVVWGERLLSPSRHCFSYLAEMNIPQSPFLSWGKIRSVTLEIGQLAHFPPWPSDQSVLVLDCLVCPGSVLTKRKWNREEAVCSAQPLVLHPKLIKLLTYQKRCTLHTLAHLIIMIIS